MSINLTEYKDNLEVSTIPIATNFNASNLFNGTAQLFHDLWLYELPTAPVAPTTAVALTRASAGSLNDQLNNSTGNAKLLCLGATVNDMSLDYAGFFIIDRLSHQGNLQVNTTSAQTTNLPTAALTRYTDGSGVMIGLSIYAGFASNYVNTVTATYTNQSGVGSRVTPLIAFPIDNISRGIGAFYILPLQAGDTGVRSVQSVTCSSNGGGGTGRFGVVLFKPLTHFGRQNIINIGACNFVDGNMIGGIPEIVDDACLSILGKASYFISNNIAAGTRCNIGFYEITEWVNITWTIPINSGSITSKQITGGQTSIKFSSPGVTLYYQVTNNEITGSVAGQPTSPWVAAATTPSSTTISVTKGQWLSFSCYNPGEETAQTVSVIDNSNGSIIDTFTIQADK